MANSFLSLENLLSLNKGAYGETRTLVRVGLLVLALEPAVDREPFDPAAQAAALVGDRAREPAEALGVQRLHALGELLVGAAQACGDIGEI